MPDFIGKAKLFWNGRSQAVRLPRECRFPGEEVIVHREGDTVILTPVHRREWPAGYFEGLGRVTEDFGLPEPLPPSDHRDVDWDAE